MKLVAEAKAKDKARKKKIPDAMWVWRSTYPKYLGMVLPVLQTIRDVFIVDAEIRNQILREFPGKENNKVRRSKLSALLLRGKGKSLMHSIYFHRNLEL